MTEEQPGFTDEPLPYEPFTITCEPNRWHTGRIEFQPKDARRPICPVCGREVSK